MAEPDDIVIAERTMEGLRAREIWLAGLAVEASRRVLDEQNETGADAAVALQRALEAEIKRANAALPDPLLPPTIAARAARPEAEREMDGMHERDAAAATYIERLGSVPTADEWREHARQRWAVFTAQGTLPGFEPDDWAQWRDNGRWQGRFARCLGAVLWETRVRAEVEAKRAQEAQRCLPGLPRTVFRSTVHTAATGLELVGDRVLRPNLTKPRHGAPGVVAAIPAEMVRVVAAGLGPIGGRYALPLIESLVATSFARFDETGDRERSRTVAYEGGWTAVTAAALEIREAAVEPYVRDAVTKAARALAHMSILWEDGARASSLWLIDEGAGIAGRGRGRARVALTLSERLAWGEAKDTRQRVVPLPRPRNLPPLPGSPRDSFGPQAVFMRLLWAFFTEQSGELAESGLITVSAAARARLSDEAQVLQRLATPLLEHMRAAGALIGDGDRYAPADEATRRYLIEPITKKAEIAKREVVRARRRRAR